MEDLQLLRIGSVLGGVEFAPTGLLHQGLDSSLETAPRYNVLGPVRKCHSGEVSAPELMFSLTKGSERAACASLLEEQPGTAYHGPSNRFVLVVAQTLSIANEWPGGGGIPA